MSQIKNLLSGPAREAITNNAKSESYGLVTKVNEKENVCEITYENSSGKLTRKENIEVRIRTDQDEWFPKTGDLVTTEETNDNQPIITGQLIRDYARDVKPKRIYAKDVQAGRKYQARGKIT